MKLPLKIILLSTLLFSCKKNSFNVELPSDDIKTIQSSTDSFNNDEKEFFNYSIKSTRYKEEYLYSFVLDNPKKELNKFHILIIDSNNRGYISFFGYEKDYSLILGDKKESNTRIIGININFNYSFEAKEFKCYSYFFVDGNKKEVKSVLKV